MLSPSLLGLGPYWMTSMQGWGMLRAVGSWPSQWTYHCIAIHDSTARLRQVETGLLGWNSVRFWPSQWTHHYIATWIGFGQGSDFGHNTFVWSAFRFLFYKTVIVCWMLTWNKLQEGSGEGQEVWWRRIRNVSVLPRPSPLTSPSSRSQSPWASRGGKTSWLWNSDKVLETFG